jgi:hypothetical protein
VHSLNPPSAIVEMTGPHPSRIRRGGKRLSVWHVAVRNAGRVPISTVYTVLSYARAVSLSCNMARDRRLFLRVDALP